MIKRLMAAAGLAAGVLASMGSASASAASHAPWVRSCAVTSTGAACNALVRTNGHGGSNGSTPVGYGPGDLQSAYALASAAAQYGGTQTVAIVDAYNDPKAYSDLTYYRSHYGLPQCTTTSGCFRQINQNGGTKLPSNNGGWAQEESLDLDMVSAICPNCHILLVEASSASFSNLGAAVKQAALQHANVISNSYGGSDASDATYGSYYNHPGIAVTASAGDSGYGVQYPASSGYVTAVGGTSLSHANNTRGWSEIAWSGTGSGCSAYNTEPSWQTSVVGSGCKMRAVADVSADADPNTGVAVYDTYSYQGQSGWLEFGGTSVASPIIASVYALAGNASTVNYGSYPYSHSSALNDVTSGSNGTCTADTQLCNAGPGWDGPTGLGTPNGTGAF